VIKRPKKKKILENQEESTKKTAGFGLQNPISQKLTETPEGFFVKKHHYFYSLLLNRTEYS